MTDEDEPWQPVHWPPRRPRPKRDDDPRCEEYADDERARDAPPLESQLRSAGWPPST